MKHGKESVSEFIEDHVSFWRLKCSFCCACAWGNLQVNCALPCSHVKHLFNLQKLPIQQECCDHKLKRALLSPLSHSVLLCACWIDFKPATGMKLETIADPLNVTTYWNVPCKCWQKISAFWTTMTQYYKHSNPDLLAWHCWANDLLASKLKVWSAWIRGLIMWLEQNDSWPGWCPRHPLLLLPEDV